MRFIVILLSLNIYAAAAAQSLDSVESEICLPTEQPASTLAYLFSYMERQYHESGLNAWKLLDPSLVCAATIFLRLQRTTGGGLPNSIVLSEATKNRLEAATFFLVVTDLTLTHFKQSHFQWIGIVSALPSLFATSITPLTNWYHNGRLFPDHEREFARILRLVTFLERLAHPKPQRFDLGVTLPGAGDFLDATCSLCLGDYEPEEETAHLACGHTFHKECIAGHFQFLFNAGRAAFCSICRAKALTPQPDASAQP